MPVVRQNSPALAALAQDFAWGSKFIIWIGSGLSVPAGLPSWSQLRTRLETRLRAAAARKLSNLNEAQAIELIAQIKRIPDPWEAFEILKARLGDQDYRQVITLALNDNSIPHPPSGLGRIWANANVDGVISLNIDNLASRSFAGVYGGRRELARATGVSLNLGLRFLSEYQPFLVQLHGRIDDEQTWVFTRPQLSALFEKQDYKAFVRSALTSRRVIFIGCSPDDPAVAQHFNELEAISLNLPNHYWFVPGYQVDAVRDATLSKMGLNIIEYEVDPSCTPKVQNEQHSSALNELFDYLESSQYSEPEPDPINPMAGPIGARLPPERIQAMVPEQARNVLSRYATSILEEPSASRGSDYDEFVKSYGAAIAVASYVPRGVDTTVLDIGFCVI